MKNRDLCIILALFVSVTACASLRGQPKSQQALILLSDFKWGVDAAGSQLWLDAKDVQTADDAVQVAEDTITRMPSSWKEATSAALTSIAQRVSTPVKWQPYLGAAQAVLALL